jgi:hypothetical protein
MNHTAKDPLLEYIGTLHFKPVPKVWIENQYDLKKGSQPLLFRGHTHEDYRSIEVWGEEEQKVHCTLHYHKALRFCIKGKSSNNARYLPDG